MATTTTNFGWDVPQSSDLVKNGATAIATLGQDIDTAFVDLKGGTTGQVLSKASGTDLDFTWVAQDDSNAIQNAIVDAKGDLIAATAADTPARLAVGTNGYVLTADSTAATGLKWAAASAGKIGQVLSTTKTDTFTTTSTSFVDVTGLSVTITPSSSTSKILVFATIQGAQSYNVGGSLAILARDSTSIGIATSTGSRPAGIASVNAGQTSWLMSAGMSYLDSPASTSSITYKVRFMTVGAGTAFINRSESDADNSSYPRGASTITVMEILA
jgi:hypothetical protein